MQREIADSERNRILVGCPNGDQRLDGYGGGLSLQNTRTRATNKEVDFG